MLTAFAVKPAGHEVSVIEPSTLLKMAGKHFSKEMLIDPCGHRCVTQGRGRVIVARFGLQSTLPPRRQSLVALWGERCTSGW